MTLIKELLVEATNYIKLKAPKLLYTRLLFFQVNIYKDSLDGIMCAVGNERIYIL